MRLKVVSRCGPISHNWLPSTYLVLRRRCFLEHKVTDGKTVSLSSTELRLFGLTRKQKYHALGQLEQRGLIRVRRQNGKNPQVELPPLCLVPFTALWW